MRLFGQILILEICSAFITVLFSPPVSAQEQDISTYSLSFAPIHNWWPTAPNSVQQIDAALWKDGDGENVKNFTNLTAEWKFDPYYYRLTDTASYYHAVCPVEKVNKRPCIDFSVHVVTLNPGRTSVQLTLKDKNGKTVWNAEPALIDDLSVTQPTPTPRSSGLSTYSISFESDPIRKWWPVAPNHYEDVTAALWKDSDGTNVKRFTNLQTEWQFDPAYFSVAYTSSNYFDQCPVVPVNSRPCIYFYASVRPNRPGNTSVQLKLRDTNGEEAWNAYPVIIEDLSLPTPTTPPEVTTRPQPTYTPLPTAIPIPSGSDYRNLEQKITMLESQVKEQNVRLNRTQSIVDSIIEFLRRLFRLRT